MGSGGATDTRRLSALRQRWHDIAAWCVGGSGAAAHACARRSGLRGTEIELERRHLPAGEGVFEHHVHPLTILCTMGVVFLELGGFLGPCERGSVERHARYKCSKGEPSNGREVVLLVLVVGWEFAQITPRTEKAPWCRSAPAARRKAGKRATPDCYVRPRPRHRFSARKEKNTGGTGS